MLKQGDLVKFANGRYGIVTNPADRTVFTSDGCDTFVSGHEWRGLQPVHDPVMDATASFVELASRYVETQYKSDLATDGENE